MRLHKIERDKMGSQESESEQDRLMDILADAAHWTEEETVDKLQEVLPVIIEFLQRNPPSEEGVQVARFVLGSFLPHIQVDDSFSLLNATLPALKLFFDEFMEECEKEAKINIDVPTRLLQHCILITESCELMVQFLMQAESIDCKKVKSLPQVVLHVMIGSLKHCKNSENIYGNGQEKVGESLNQLFQQTLELSRQFSGLLPKLIFDTYEDINVLIDVCEQLPVTASCLSQLSEVRACVVVWRAFTSLIQLYHTHLITDLDISGPLSALIKEISDSLLLMSTFTVQSKKLNERDQKVTQRIIKMVSFCLKIVIVLCEKFKGYLRSAHKDLGKLLILLYRFYPENVVLQKFPDVVKMDVERQVTVGVEPLLSHLREDEDFVKVTIDFGTEDTENKEDCIDWGSYLLLLIGLSTPPSPVTSIYVNSILDKMFETLQMSHVSLSYPCKMSGVMCGGKPQSSVTIYEHVLTRICSLVTTLEPENFMALEQLLIKWLLCGLTWPALMAADVWTFVARYGTSELCKSHCFVLAEILPHAPLYSHQQVVLSSLLTRLISKLSSADKTEFFSHLMSSGSLKTMDAISLCCAVREDCKTQETKTIRKNLLNSCSQTIKAVVSKKSSGEDVSNLLIGLEHIFPMLGNFPLTDDEDAVAFTDCIEDMALLWSRFPVEHSGCSAIDLLASGLLNSASSSLNHFSNKQLTQMACMCKDICQASPVVGIAVCTLVAAAGKCNLLLSTTSSEVTKILDFISDWLFEVLQSKNPLVFQCALDSFVAFGQHTVHENVLPSCLQKCEEELQAKVTNFLQQEAHKLPEGCSTCDILQQQNIASYKDIPPKARMNFILIKEPMPAENTTVLHNADVEVDFKSSKRKREEDLPCPKSYNIKRILESLQETRNVIRVLRKNNDLERDDKDNLQILLQEIVSEISY